MVDGIAAPGDALDGEHREAVDLVVVAGVVAVGTLVGHLSGVDVSLQHHLGKRRHLQIRADGLDQLGALAAQQAGEGVLGQGIGHRGYRAENGCRIGTQSHRHRIGTVRVLLAPLAVVQGAAAMAEPAHDHLVAANHLLTIDPQVLALFVRPAGHGQAPGNQRRDIARPAVLHRQHAEVDVVAFDDHFVAGGILDHFRCHRHDLLEDRQLRPGILEALGRLRLLEEGQQLADFAQLADRLGAHAHGHPLRGAKQVAEHRNVEARRLFEQ
ncbi:hypothetical protein D3C81_1254250 [compost metagenome]